MSKPGSVATFPPNSYSTDSGYANQLGLRVRGADADFSGSVLTTNSQGERELVLVLNDSGGTLVCGQALKFKTGYRGKRVQKSSAGAKIVGYVPPEILGDADATIPDQAYFYMIKEGPTSILKDASTVNEGDQVEASATAGQVKSQSGTGSYQNFSGTAWVTDATASAELIRAYANCQW